jgi:hypothetical protein
VRELRHIIYTPACSGVQDWTCPYAHRVLRIFHTWLSFISTSHIFLGLHLVCGNRARRTHHIWQKSTHDIHELWLIDWLPFTMNDCTLTSDTHVQQHSAGVFALRGLRKHAICLYLIRPATVLYPSCMLDVVSRYSCRRCCPCHRESPSWSLPKLSKYEHASH